MSPNHPYCITYEFIILLMLLFNSSGVLVCLEYPDKHDKLHQGLEYIVYLRYCIDSNYITVVFKVSICV